MAKYGSVVYKGAYYGESPRIPFSVEPFTATAIDYDKVFLTWNNPTGALNGIRLVRNQEGFGEFPEDGVVLFERNGDPSTFGDTTYTDGLDNFLDSDTSNDIGLVSGRWVYYRMWVRREDNLWTVANDVYIILPKKHGTNLPDGTELLSTQVNFMDLLPRVFTSTVQSPLGTIDPESTLYQFLSGMSFTLDETLTLSDLLLPDFSGRNYGPGILELKSKEYGLFEEEPSAIIRKKRMTREALYMYARKGTELGVGTMVESLTGYAPRITYSPNLFLSNQDSTFNKSLGYWRTIGDITLAVENNLLTPTVEAKSLDTEYCAKVTVSDVNARIENGTYRPVTRGIPIQNGEEYTFSIYAKKPGGSNSNVILGIVWYNRRGEELSRVSSTSSAFVLDGWSKFSVTGTAPGNEYEVDTFEAASNLVTVNFTEPHSFTSGQTVTVSGLGAEFDGVISVSAITSTSISYLRNVDDTPETAPDTIATVFTEPAVYAGVSVQFSLTGDYYIDLSQFALSSVTEYEEARGVNIFLESNKENFIKNPSFNEATANEWTISGVSPTNITYPDTTLPFIYSGSSMLSVDTVAGTACTISTTTDVGDKPVDKLYVFSIYSKTATGTESVKLKITAFDDTDSVVSESTPYTLTNQWTRLHVGLYVPDTFVADELYFVAEVVVETPTGNVVNFDAAQLEKSYHPTDYFDGSFPAEYGIAWSGTAHASSSHAYKNKQVKIIRLIQELENYLPSNTPYIVSSYAGTEVTGITL